MSGTSTGWKFGHGYWTVFASATVSSLGDGIRLVAMPLLAFSITGSAVDISLIMVIAALPGLLFGSVIGVLVDRFDRRWILTAANALRTVLVLAFALLVLSGSVSLWHIYAVTAALSIAELFAESTTFAMIATPVPPELLEKANSRFFAARLLSQQVLGSPIAGVLFGIAVSAPFFAEGGLFLAAAVISLMIPVLKSPPGREPSVAPSPSTMLRELHEGLCAIRDIPLLRALALSDAALNYLMLTGTALLVVFAKRDLGLTDAQYALLFTAAALGSLLGGLLVPALVRRAGVPWTLALTLLVTGLSRLGLGLASGPWLAIATFFTCGGAIFMWEIALGSYQQRVTPNHLLGRVHATTYALGYGAAVVAALTGGLLAELVGVRPVIVVGAVATLALSCYWIRLAVLRPPPAPTAESLPTSAAG
ncbi:MFS transporter [Streptomyces sp. HK10]|uniref:MFS transporter n=1 Tax=Streptomyces sp. HK10 TaxID=3373255 RepID=UPI003749D0C5